MDYSQVSKLNFDEIANYRYDLAYQQKRSIKQEYGCTSDLEVISPSQPSTIEESLKTAGSYLLRQQKKGFITMTFGTLFQDWITYKHSKARASI